MLRTPMDQQLNCESMSIILGGGTANADDCWRMGRKEQKYWWEYKEYKLTNWTNLTNLTNTKIDKI